MLRRRPPAGLCRSYGRAPPEPAPPPPPEPARPPPRSLLALLGGQCGYVTGQRLRLYGGFCPERPSWGLLRSLWRRPPARSAGAGKLLLALGGAFLWEEERIRAEELLRSAEEMKHMEEVSRLFHGSGGEQQKLAPKPQVDITTAHEEQPWEIVMDKKHFKLWRRPIEGTHLYQYRVFGTYTDVTPRQFFNVQLDTEYRKKWDSLVIKLDVIERDVTTGSEVVHWVTHFPYPMYSRDYVYVRRYNVDQENNLMVLVSRAVEHPSVPEDPKFVRVRTYESQMVIRPHKTFDENGFDYMLTYSDNPQTVFPRHCVSWMVSDGMPAFLEKLHAAALKAKGMKLEVQDYISAKPIEGGGGGGGSEEKASMPRAERKSKENQSPAQLEYA
ncbi:stAR-related lipid transfer protein 7, mitochondrial [Carettochelys insculpta]|uniref:stAR-related lipid transfer protein 7, mitochondrial n=1 Tax=Carettochelys insculpta TaxID=44489 RepID=UPI003EB98AC7